MVEVYATEERDLSTHEGFLVVALEDCVFARVGVEYLFLWLDLSADVKMLDFADIPFPFLSHENKVSGFGVNFLFDNRI